MQRRARASVAGDLWSDVSDVDVACALPAAAGAFGVRPAGGTGAGSGPAARGLKHPDLGGALVATARRRHGTVGTADRLTGK